MATRRPAWDVPIHVNVQNAVHLSGCATFGIVFSSCASGDLSRLFCRSATSTKKLRCNSLKLEG